MEQTASAPTAFRRKTKVISLPDPGPDGELRVVIRHVNMAELFRALGGIPGYGEPMKGTETFSQARAAIEVDSESARAAAQLGLIEPGFSFGPDPEEGKAWWGDLSYINQQFIAKQICVMAGVNSSAAPDLEAASDLARFPAEQAGTVSG